MEPKRETPSFCPTCCWRKSFWNFFWLMMTCTSKHQTLSADRTCTQSTVKRPRIFLKSSHTPAACSRLFIRDHVNLVSCSLPNSTMMRQLERLHQKQCVRKQLPFTCLCLLLDERQHLVCRWWCDMKIEWLCFRWQQISFCSNRCFALSTYTHHGWGESGVQQFGFGGATVKDGAQEPLFAHVHVRRPKR